MGLLSRKMCVLKDLFLKGRRKGGIRYLTSNKEDGCRHTVKITEFIFDGPEILPLKQSIDKLKIYYIF
jgi:hypothetical protein